MVKQAYIHFRKPGKLNNSQHGSDAGWLLAAHSSKIYINFPEWLDLPGEHGLLPSGWRDKTCLGLPLLQHHPFNANIALKKVETLDIEKFRLKNTDRYQQHLPHTHSSYVIRV